MRRPKSKPEPGDACALALGLLSRREYSRDELRRRLDARGVDAREREQALDELAGKGWQDDARFAGAFARTRVAAGYGPVRIRAELAQRGIDAAGIEAALESCECDFAASARELAARRCAGKALRDPAVRRKTIEFLLRRGFANADAYSAVRSVGERATDEADGD